MLRLFLISGAYLTLILVCVLITFYVERKLSAFVQDRLGPMYVGKYGSLQAIADLVKMIQKEDIIPTQANKWLFIIAPLVIFTAVFTGFVVVPFAQDFSPIQLNTGAFFILAVVSLDVIGLLLAGWASNNKFSLIGAMRSVSQILSYELPVAMTIICVAMLTQSLDLNEIMRQQGIHSEVPIYLFGLKATGIEVTQIGGIFTWNVVKMPLFFVAYIIFYIATLAESNRAPFDIPEGESEIIGGFHTEYSGFRFALFFLAEYAMMMLVSALGIILFFGGGNTPLPNLGSVALADWTTGELGAISGYAWTGFWLFAKTIVVLFTQVWVRWTFPRLRGDQLMYLGWKVLTPACLVLILLTGIWRLLMI